MSQGVVSEFSLPWSVFSSYRVKTAQLCGRGEFRKTYEAAEEPWLALEFARVNWPARGKTSKFDSGGPEERARAYLAFAAIYGALTNPPEPGVSVSVDEAHKLHDVAWALLHAAAIDFVITVNGALATGQVELVDQQLDALEVTQKSAGFVKVPSQSGTSTLEVALPPQKRRTERVQMLTAAILNPNLSGTRRLQGGRETVVFDSLSALLHSQVATWSVRGQFGQCDGCGGFFPQTDGRQKYCPALLGQKESRCAMRDRSRRRRSGGAENPLRRVPGELLLRPDCDLDPNWSCET